MTKFYLICTFLCVLSLTNTYAQDFREGDSLLIAKCFDEALLAYERSYFEITEMSDNVLSSEIVQEVKNNCVLRKVYCLKTMGKFEEASKTALRFDFTNLSDSSQYALRNELVVCYYLSGFYEDALSQIQQLKFYVKDSLLQQRSDIWQILCLTQLKRYGEAKDVFREYIKRKSSSIDVDSVFAFEKATGFRDIKKAVTLATFIPGVGMLYVGNKTEGFVSLGLQAATLGFGIHNVLNGYYFSGFFTGFGLFQAFYFGGIRHTELLAERKNKQLADEYTKAITKVLLELEK